LKLHFQIRKTINNLLAKLEARSTKNMGCGVCVCVCIAIRHLHSRLEK
jgi:hypothetical protein